jgi:hypothetical protein
MREHTDTIIDTERFPHDPTLPKGDILIDIFTRLSDLSDALHDPDGMLQTRLAAQDNMATRRYMAHTNILRKILAEVLEIKSRMDAVEDTVETHEAKFTLAKNTVTHQEIQ